MQEQGIDTTILEAAFYGSLVVFALLEMVLPRRRERYSIGVRWVSNFALLAMELLLAWLLLPGGLVLLAFYAQEQGWGLLSLIADGSWLLIAVISVLLLDLVKYWEHRLLHRSSWLWRAHVVHHADLDVDFTTTLRHHTFEVLFSVVIGALAVVSLGLSPLGVFIFSVLAAIVTVMSHANMKWNTDLDRVLRMLIVTRDAHAVHHSALKKETDANFGVVFLWWDRLFGTYRAAPEQGLDDFTIGVEYFRSPRDLTLSQVLTMPFRVPVVRRSGDGPSDTVERPESAA